MKNLKPFLFVLGLFVIQNTFSQSVFPDASQNQKWEYVTWHFWGGYCEKRIILTGNHVRKCNQSYIEVFDCDGDGNDCMTIGYYRVHNDSVLVRFNHPYYENTIDTVICSEPEGLMYDFGAAQDELLVCQISSVPNPEYTDFWKIQEETINYEGIDRQTLTMNYRPYPNHPTYISPMKWISGIGSTVHPFYPFTCIGDHCEWEQQLTKVYRGDEVIYQDTISFSYPCTGWVGTNDINELEQTEIKLFPNPANTNFSILSEGMERQEVSVIVSNLLGKKLIIKANYPIGENIAINHLTPGAYIVKVNGKNFRKTMKLIKY